MSNLLTRDHFEELYNLFSIESSQYFVKLQKIYNLLCRAFLGDNYDKYRNSNGTYKEYEALINTFNAVSLDNRLLRSFCSTWKIANETKHSDDAISFEHNYARLCAENYNKIVKSILDPKTDFSSYLITISNLKLQANDISETEKAFAKAIQKDRNLIEPDQTSQNEESVSINELSTEKDLLKTYVEEIENRKKSANLCPKCNSQMVKKTNRKDNSEFWGCSQYFTTGCRGTRDILSTSSVLDKNYLYDESIWFVARPRSKQAKAEFVQSIGLMSGLLDHITINDTLSDEIKRYSHWRFDFKPHKQIANDDVLYVCNQAYKILTRGRVTTISPFVEKQLKGHWDVIDSKLVAFEFFINYQKQIQNSTSFDLDGLGTEKYFYEKLLPEICGSNYYNYIIPQADLSTLIGADTELGNQRVDFAIKDRDLKLVIELDDDSHRDHKEYDQYRDKLLTDSGFTVIRIPNKEVLQGSGKNIDQLIDLLSYYKSISSLSIDDSLKAHIAAKIVHQIEIVTVYALMHGALNTTANVNVDLSTNVLTNHEKHMLLKTASEDINQLLNNIAKLCSFEAVEFDLEYLFEANACKFEISFNQSESPTNNCYVVTDMVYSDDFVNILPHYSNPVKYSTDKKLLEYFLMYIFRKESFREGQYQAVRNALTGVDSIVLLPTGAGKSIAFQLVCFLIPGIAFVVSPLVSLMEDQVDNLSRYGIDRVAALTGTMDAEDKKQLTNLITMGDINITYISPERLQIKSFRDAIEKTITDIPIPLFVIDEVHCLSEWGHDFRTSYLNLGRIIRDYCKFDNKEPIILALTGTASDNVLKDIQAQLNIWNEESLIVPMSFDRKELHYRVIYCETNGKNTSLNSQLQMLPYSFNIPHEDFYSLNGEDTCSGIIFCPHVNGEFGVYEVCNSLKSHYNCDFYSGKKPKKWTERSNWNEKKRKTSKEFKDNRFNLLVATTAYGMGIDKGNIRYVIHYNMPQSIEAYYQETGRAGRNGDDAECILLASLEGKFGQLLEGSTLEELKEKDSLMEDDDVRRILFFHNSSFKGINYELNRVKDVLGKIDPEVSSFINCSFQDFHQNEPKQDKDISSEIEKAIYRLLLIGVIEDYTKIRKMEYRICLPNISKESISKSYADFVAKYHVSRVENELKNLSQYNDLPLRDYIIEVVKHLLNFMYDNIERGRRYAIQSMYTLLKEAQQTDDQDDTIRNGIINYLKTSEQESILGITGTPNGGFEKIRVLFDKTYSDTSNIQTLRAQISRALESTPDHPGLMMSRALIDLRSGKKDLFENAIIEILIAIDYARNRYNIEEYSLSSFIGWFLYKANETNDKEMINNLTSNLLDTVDTDMLIESVISQFGECEILVPFGYHYLNSIANNVMSKAIITEVYNEPEKSRLNNTKK